MRAVVIAALCVLAVASAAAAGPAAEAPATVGRALRAADRTGQIPPTFVVSYSDQAGRFGPETFVLRANGRLQRTGPGPADAPETRTVRIRRSEVLGVIRLLVRLRAWRQPTVTQPPPHVVFVHIVRIRVAGATTRVWDWHRGGREGDLGLVGARLSRLFSTHR
jgi:hypothetical protein